MKVLLGGLPAELELPAAIAEPLGARYAGYPAAGEPVLWAKAALIPGLSVEVDDRDYPAAVATWDGARYRIRRRDLDATLDLESGELTIRARPAHWVVESALRVAVSLLLPRRNGLLLHASGVVEAGRGHVFAGRSGAGKTTMVRLLAPRPPLGDDLVALLPDGDGFRVHATPFAGEYGPVACRSAPLGRLYFLEQAVENRLSLLDRAAARTLVLRNTLAYVRDPITARALQEVAGRLVEAVPCCRLRFRREPAIGELLHEPGER